MTIPRLHPLASLVVKILISVFALWVVWMFIDLHAVLSSFRNADSVMLIIGLFLSFVQLFLHILRWKFLVNMIDPSISLREAAVSFLVGQAAGFFTPVQIGEFVGRIVSHPGTDRSQIIGISIIDKAYIGAITFVIGGIGMTAFMSEVHPELWHWSYRYLSTFVFGLVLSFMLYPSMATALLQFLPQRIRTHRYYKTGEVLESIFTDRAGRRTTVWTLAIYAVILAENHILLNAFTSASYESTLIGTGSVFFFKSYVFPFSFSDIGIREGASVYFFGALGVATAAAFNTSILVSFFNILVPTMTGAVLSSTLIRRKTS